MSSYLSPQFKYIFFYIFICMIGSAASWTISAMFYNFFTFNIGYLLSKFLLPHRWVIDGWRLNMMVITCTYKQKKILFLKLNQMRRAHSDRKFTSEAREDEIYSANRKAWSKQIWWWPHAMTYIFTSWVRFGSFQEINVVKSCQDVTANVMILKMTWEKKRKRKKRKNDLLRLWYDTNVSPSGDRKL